MVTVSHSSSLPSSLPVAVDVDQEIAIALATGDDDSVVVSASGALTSCPRDSADGALAAVDLTSSARPVVDAATALSTSWMASWMRNLLPPYRINPCDSPADDAPTATDERSDAAGEEVPRHFAFVLALLAILATVLSAILPDAKDTVAGWCTGAKVVYGVTAVATIATLAVGLMAAGRHAAAAGGSRAMLSVSALCAKLGAVLSTAILVVLVSCKLGKWGCVAGVPSAAVIAAAMAVVGVWAGAEERAAARAVSGCWRHVREPRRGGSLPVTRYSN